MPLYRVTWSAKIYGSNHVEAETPEMARRLADPTTIDFDYHIHRPYVEIEMIEEAEDWLDDQV
jgi:hypothetical protein